MYISQKTQKTQRPSRIPDLQHRNLYPAFQLNNPVFINPVEKRYQSNRFF